MNDPLRAPRRRRQGAVEKDHLPAILGGLVAIALVALGAAEFSKIRRDHAIRAAALQDEQRRAERAAPAERRIEQRSGPHGPVRPVVTTESGRTYYVPVTPAAVPEPPPKSNSQRYDEAMAWMESSRQTQRQLDQQQYAQQTGRQVIADGHRSDRCRSIENARAAIHAAMRRPYDHQLGEYYRERLRENHAQRMAAQC